jgi:7,8-dihydropterin-6-yl-methyl-4-(beta-D-ribofuranosyl)aminobenzene 5'-phosphate synthase
MAWLLLMRPQEAISLRLVILYDNRVSQEGLVSGWGFSVLVDLGGQQLLFDTGADGLILERNAKLLGVDLEGIDILVFSHHHCDHIGAHFLIRRSGLDVYCTSSVPKYVVNGILRAGGHIHESSEPICVAPKVITTGELGTDVREQGLIIQTSGGPILLTGCAHPGVGIMIRVACEVASAAPRMVLGGFHLSRSSHATVCEIATELNDAGVSQIAPCHCTGEGATAVLRKHFRGQTLDVSAGSDIPLRPVAFRGNACHPA